MKKKVWIIIGIVVVVVAAAALLLPRLFGGSHRGIDNEPEASVAGESKILVAYFSWSGNGQQMARWIAEETGGELFRIVPEESYVRITEPAPTVRKTSWTMKSVLRFPPTLTLTLWLSTTRSISVSPFGGTICRRRYGHSSKNTIFPARRSFRFSLTTEAPAEQTV